MIEITGEGKSAVPTPDGKKPKEEEEELINAHYFNLICEGGSQISHKVDTSVVMLRTNSETFRKLHLNVCVGNAEHKCGKRIMHLGRQLFIHAIT